MKNLHQEVKNLTIHLISATFKWKKWKNDNFMNEMNEYVSHNDDVDVHTSLNEEESDSVNDVWMPRLVAYPVSPSQ